VQSSDLSEGWLEWHRHDAHRRLALAGDSLFAYLVLGAGRLDRRFDDVTSGFRRPRLWQRKRQRKYGQGAE